MKTHKFSFRFDQSIREKLDAIASKMQSNSYRPAVRPSDSAVVRSLILSYKFPSVKNLSDR